jgi:hypothetical protein
MTGKFHTAWGDFHSFKNEKSLEYECFRTLAHNAKVCIGDQLHPSGKVCPHTYELIGGVYAQVEQKEPWCRAATPVTEIGVLTPDEFHDRNVVDSGMNPDLVGATRILTEGAHQFDIIDSHADFSAYRLLVLPDSISVSRDLARRLEEFVAGGGKLLATFESGLEPGTGEFATEIFGARKAGEGPRDSQGRLARGRFYPSHDFTDYILPNERIGRNLPATEHATYIRGLDIVAADDAEVLAHSVKPYFDRTWAHFCSHLQTPSSGEAGAAAVIRKEGVVYVAHPLFRIYQTCAPLWIKQLALDAVELLLPDPLLRHDGPSVIEAAINSQPARNRWVLHLMNYQPLRRSEHLEVIEDVLPYYDLGLSVKTPQKPSALRAVPEGSPVEFTLNDGRVEFTLAKLEGHQMIEIAF